MASSTLGLHFGRLDIEDAIGIASCKSVQQRLGSGVVAGVVVGLSAQKVRVVGQHIAGLARLAQIAFGFGCIAYPADKRGPSAR